MKAFCICGVIACCSVSVSPALAQDHGEHHAETELKAVNAMCPVGNEPIDGETFAQYKGKTVGFCCSGCDSKFMAWDETRRDQFITAAMSQPAADDHEGHGGHGEAQAEVDPWTEPYALTTCAVSGEKLGSMGDPIVKQYDGREVRFCCSGCIDKFEADRAGYWQKIDEQIIEDQLRYYPTETCVVSGEPLVADGEDIAKNMVYGNRLVRLCCNMCKREFKADPAKFIEKLDKAVAKAQRADYPLETCVVRGGPLGSMGEPAEMVIAGRLMRFCCAGCEPKVNADPAKYIALIDAAWLAQGSYMPEDDSDHGAHDDHDADEPGHGGHGDHDGHDDHDG